MISNATVALQNPHHRKAIFLLIHGWLWISLTSIASGADWPQFLGPDRDGKVDAVGLVDNLNPDTIRLVWETDGGAGMSGMAVAEGLAVTLWNREGQQFLGALDTETGKARWVTAVAPLYRNTMGNGPRATPTIVDGMIYAHTGEGILVAVDSMTGEISWRVNTVQENQTQPAEYGMASSPLVWEDRVILHTGGRTSAVCAYDSNTGEKIWEAGAGSAGYSSPTLQRIDGAEQIVSFVASGLIGIDPHAGRVLWSFPFETPYDCNTATPVVNGNSVFISAGENHGCVLLDIQRQGSSYMVAPKWKSVDSKSVMRNEWQTSIVIDQYLYGFDNVGSAGPVTHFSCLDANTGERAWQETRFGKGNLTYADGKFWITTMQGELVLVKADPDRYHELGRLKLFGKTRQSLSIADGRGYIRDDQKIYCFDLRKQR
ncbi:MAG: PQQ-binding-like beta-propeller repeat protein, partial [Rubripirellula sp.]